MPFGWDERTIGGVGVAYDRPEVSISLDEELEDVPTDAEEIEVEEAEVSEDTDDIDDSEDGDTEGVTDGDGYEQSAEELAAAGDRDGD